LRDPHVAVNQVRQVGEVEFEGSRGLDVGPGGPVVVRRRPALVLFVLILLSGVLQQQTNRLGKLKLKTLRSVHQARAKFFANRVVTHWNGLPDDVVSAGTTNEFKNRLDRHWAAMNLNQS